MPLDHSVYPDLENPPDTLESDGDKADYVMRICGAWDYGILPYPETFTLFAEWRNIFDLFPLPHSPAYTAFRTFYGWPSVSDERVSRKADKLLDEKPFHTCTVWYPPDAEGPSS